MEPVILIHGGAETISPERLNDMMYGIQVAAKIGSELLQKDGSAIDAVEKVIRYLESNEFFNAGVGSVLNDAGVVEMEASIMDGSDMSAGAVAIITDIKHPISLARLVKDKSPYVLLTGSGASHFGKDNGMKTVLPEKLVTDYAKLIWDQEIFSSEASDFGGTVGAVAIDKNGNVAAGTSTGGVNGKLSGKIGGTPIIGCGTYADNRFGAVSCTGHAESILRMCLGHSIIHELELGNTPGNAAQKCVELLQEKTEKTAGAICISKTGTIGLYFTTSMMPWAFVEKGQLYFGIQLEDYCNQCRL